MCIYNEMWENMQETYISVINFSLPVFQPVLPISSLCHKVSMLVPTDFMASNSNESSLFTCAVFVCW